MLLHAIIRAAAPLLLAAVTVAQPPIYIAPGFTDAGTSGNDDFIVDYGGHCTAYLEGGADYARILGSGPWGAQVDVNDCAGDDVVDAYNGVWDLIMADFGDIVLVDWYDTVIIDDCVTGETRVFTGQEYYEWLGEAFWEWIEEYYDQNGFYPWEYEPGGTEPPLPE